ncbi:MAG: DUF1330 domain-containing protein [Pseudomonadota bacterium]
MHGQVNDFERYLDDYVPGVGPPLHNHRGRSLVGAQEPVDADGTLAGNCHVLIEFPSMDAAKSRYNDLENSPLLDLRVKEVIDGGTLTILQGFVPPS